MDPGAEHPRRQVIAAKRRPDRLAVEWWLVLLLATGLVVACVATGFTDRFDLLLYDFAQRQLPQTPRQDILLVTVDDRSLAEIGPWPWPRATQARLLQAVAKSRPRAVALDVLLSEPGDAAGDAALATAIRGGPPTYLPVQFVVPGRDGADFNVLEPLPPFRAAATGLGHVNLSPDADGVIRRVYLDYAAGGRNWPHLVTWLSHTGRGAESAPAVASPLLRAQHPVMIAYAGPQGSFPAISAASLIRGEVPPEALAGKWVLVGVTATGVGDTYATPVSTDHSLMPGLEIQANVLNALLTNRGITPVEGGFRYTFMLAPIMAMLLGLRRLRPRRTLWVLVALLGAVLGGAGLLLAGGHMWIAPGSALFGLIAIYPLWSWRRLASLSAYIATELEKLEAEHDPLERARPTLAQADFVERQIGLLRSAIDRERDLRRFLIDRIAQMPDAVVIIDPAGKVVIANDGAVALWRSLGGDTAPAMIEPLLARLGTAPIGGGGSTAWQVDAATADGRSFTVQCEPQRAADDAVIGAVIRVTETTDAVLAQRQREEVLQLLSHDMRAPQVSILTLLDGDTTGRLAAPVAQRVRNYAERTLGLADGFVQLARAQSLRFEPQPVDLGDVMREAADALWPQAVARHVTIHCDVPDEEVLVMGDRSLLARMFVNLIDNATRFSASGQVIRATLVASHNTCSAIIADDGAGIAPEPLARLFERFTSSAQGVGGVGLGLAFVHATVLRHGGRIDCASELGCGTRFTLRFPMVRDPA